MTVFHHVKVLAFLLVVVTLQVFSARLTVSKAGNAQFTSIQAAVDAAAPYDEIVILDTAVYKEQVTIDCTKNGLWLHSVDPKALTKPIIRYQDTKNVNPKNTEESKNEATINFDRNGALQILGARRVRIEGVAVDGGKPFVFGYDAVWSSGQQAYPLQHGNGGIIIRKSGEVAVRYCDISNAFFGIIVMGRNIGGIYAMINPSDTDSLDLIPFAGFGHTGNHLVENNRIHDNSFGMYFESSWDCGSTIRYNLFYENHHASSSFAKEVENTTSEGGDFPGGAIMTKDNVLSPLAIYNNTFWHNRMIFVGVWKSGGQHIVFNNIYGTPGGEGGGDVYYSDFQIPAHLDMFKSYANRMHNCVIASQQQPPTSNYISITNDFSQPDEEGDITTKPITASAEIRYLEMGMESATKFLSTDPASAAFLEPDWTDELVANYIIDQGWETSGVKDLFGSRADLGAVSSEEGAATWYAPLITIRPATPVVIRGNTATLNFFLDSHSAPVGNLKIVSLGVVTGLDSSDVFGNAYKAISMNRIHKVQLDDTFVNVGANSITVGIPASLADFAFFEMMVEGLDVNGKFVYASTVFFPYRNNENSLHITVQDVEKKDELLQVRVGTPVNIHIETFKQDSTKIDSVLNTIVLRLGSQATLQTLDGSVLDTLKEVNDGIMMSGVIDIPAVFNSVPEGGMDFIFAAGKCHDVSFIGVSASVEVLPDLTGIRTPALYTAPRNTAEQRYEVIDLRGRVVSVVHGAPDRSNVPGRLSTERLTRGVYFIRFAGGLQENASVQKHLIVH